MLCGTSGKAALQEADLVGEESFCLPAFLPFTFLKNETALRIEGWQSREKEQAQLWNPTLDRLRFDFYFFFFFGEYILSEFKPLLFGGFFYIFSIQTVV